MTNQHPITPPPELVKLWQDEWFDGDRVEISDTYIANRSAQWGADQELDACCAEVSFYEGKNLQVKLRAARRPKPLTDKEQALADLDSMSIEPCLINGIDVNASVRVKYNNIRRALEQLPND
jgi:hypothetical protein